MEERGIRENVAVRALCHASECHAEADERWRAFGHDLDGERLEIVVVIEDGLIIITLY